MARPDITIDIGAETRRLEGALNRASGQLEGFGDRARTTARNLGGAIVAGFAIDRLADFGGQMATLGGQLESMSVKAETVFGDQLDSVERWADANNEAFGVTESQLTGMATNLADLLKPMGFTAEAAARMSEQMVGLSGALSAWSGGTRSAAEVSDILNRALMGERDSLKPLGIDISQAEVNTRALTIAQADGRDAATEMDEALATQALIMEKSTDAQTAWTDGSMDALQTQNELKAKMAELKETLARKLYPVFQAVTQFLVDRLIPAIEGIVKWMKEHKGIVLGVAVVVGGALVAAFVAWAASAAAAAAATLAATWPVLAIGAAIAALVAGVIWAYQNWGWFRDTVDTVARFLTDVAWPAIRTFAEFVIAVFQGIVTTVTTVWTTVRDVFVTVVGFITSMPERISTAARGMWDGIKNAFKSALNWIIDKWNGFDFTIDAVKIAGRTVIPGFTLGLPDIPRLDTGGTFRAPTPGGGGLAWLRDGERVTTPNRGQMAAGPTVLVLDGRQIGRVVDDARATRRSGRDRRSIRMAGY